jgi:hypothetical protein
MSSGDIIVCEVRAITIFRRAFDLFGAVSESFFRQRRSRGRLSRRTYLSDIVVFDTINSPTGIFVPCDDDYCRRHDFGVIESVPLNETFLMKAFERKCPRRMSHRGTIKRLLKLSQSSAHMFPTGQQLSKND